MKKIIFFLLILTLYGCNKPKTVLICGDHVCVNKAEAEQYFEDNLTLEVKILDKKKTKEINLVEINLESESQEKREITLVKKKQTRKKLKDLSEKEIKKKKDDVNKRRKIKKKEIKDKKIIKQAKIEKSENSKKINDNLKKSEKIVNKAGKKINDICTILEKCSIDEISKYLVNQGNEKRFPDITIREN